MKRLMRSCFSALNRCLSPFGLKLKRVEHPTRDFRAFFRHLRGLGWNFLTIVDVGVAYGTQSIYSAYPNARYYLIEPLEECLPTLEGLKRRLNADYFVTAVGDKNSEGVFHVHPDLSGSSLFDQAEGPLLDGISRNITVRRLDALLPNQLNRPVLLKLDTQGAELLAVAGLGSLLEQIDMLIIETSFMKFRIDSPEFAEVVTHMKMLNYVVYDILEGHVRALDGALAQVDLVFVPENSVLRSSRRFFSNIQAEQYLAG